MVHEMRDVAIETSVDGERAVAIVVVQIEQIRAPLGVVNLSPPLGFLVRYHLRWEHEKDPVCRNDCSSIYVKVRKTNAVNTRILNYNRVHNE